MKVKSALKVGAVGRSAFNANQTLVGKRKAKAASRKPRKTSGR